MNFVQQVFGRVWEISLSATVLIALGWLVMVILGRRMPAWARYGIWLLVFLRLMLPLAPKAQFSAWNLWRVRQAAAERVTFERPAGYKPAILQIENRRHDRRVPILPMVWLMGTLAWVGLALVRHRRLARWVRGRGRCEDEWALLAVNRARAAFNLRKQVSLVINDRFEAPAVFGWRRPTLLLPESWLKEASEEEVYSVLLHEMAHVKCRDALLNWVVILLRSIHWFNPFVWYAFRRLRAEREVFCDALVLKRLQGPERAVYGNMLLRMAAQLSGATAPPTLVPILQHKPEIHRRIHMIAKYKSTPWVLSAAFTLLLIALAGITFTRAAEKKAPAVAAPPERSRSVDVLEQEFAKQQEIVRKLQGETSALGDRAETFGAAELLQKLRGQRIEAQAELTRLSSLFQYLAKQNKLDLRQSINTASPDAQLSELFQQQANAEQKMAELIEDRAPEHPDVKRLTRVLAQINKQIDDRLNGVMRGLEARVAAEEAHLKALDNALDEATVRYREGLQRNRPYQEIQQELRAQEEILQRLRLRLADERVSNALERAK